VGAYKKKEIIMNNDAFNDVGGLGRYRRPNKKMEALEPFAPGIKGRHEKDYPDQVIADDIKAMHPTHPVLKDVTARDIRQFRTQGSRRGTSPKKATTPPTTNTEGGSGLAS
jgi:hypothetical protein